MNGYLLDTNVISMVYKSDPTTAFAQWIDKQDALQALHLSAVTVHEIEKGIRLLEHKGATAKAAAIRAWMTGLVAGYGASILPVDADVARVSGELEAVAIAAGHSPGAADAMIAGTAQYHGLAIVSRNRKHFQSFGLAVLEPDQLTA